MYRNYDNYAQYPPDNEEVVRKYSYDLMSSDDMRHALNKVEVIIVDAWAPWCRPCKTASQKFEALGEKCLQYIETKRLLLLKDNIDNEDTSHHRSMVDVVPTFFVYIKGQLATMFTGVDFDRLLAYIVQYFATYPEAQSLPQEQEMYQMTPQNNSQEQRREQGREQGQGQGQGREPSVRSMPQIKQNTIQYPPKNI